MKLSRVTFYNFLTAALLVTPLVSSAQYEPASQLIFRIGVWVNIATPVLAGLALLVFFWGLVRFIFHAGDEENRKEGKKFMGWGIIALFVLVSIWGIVFFISRSLGTGIGGSLPAPCVEGVPGCNPFGGGSGGTGNFFFSIEF